MSAAVLVPNKVIETIISCVVALGLEEVSRKHLIRFKELRQLFEKQIEEKRTQTDAKITKTSYKMSIVDAGLEI